MQRMTLADYLSSDEEIAAFLHQRLAGFAEGVRANPAVIETANRIFNEIPLLAVTDPPRDFIVSQPFWFEAQSLAANISSSLSIAYANDENAKPTKKKFASYQELVETLLNESLNEFVHHAFLAACEDILGSNGEIREDLRQCFTTAGLTDQAILRDSRFKLPLLTGYVSLLICGSTAFQELLVALDAKVDCADEAMPVNAVYAMVVAYVHAAMDQLAMKLNNKEIEIDKNTIKIITYCFMEDKEEVRRRAYDKLLPELAEPKLVLWSADEINGNVERFYAMLSDMEEANEAGRLGVFLNLAYPGLTFPLHYILSTAVSVEDLRKKMAASQNRINEFENQLVYRNHAFAEYYNYLPYKLRVLLLCMEWQFKTTKNRELCPNMYESAGRYTANMGGNDG